MEVYEGAGEGSIPLSRVMDTNFFISPSLIIKQPRRPPAAQYFWYYCKYSPQHLPRKGKREYYFLDVSQCKEGRSAKDLKLHIKYIMNNIEQIP